MTQDISVCVSHDNSLEINILEEKIKKEKEEAQRNLQTEWLKATDGRIDELSNLFIQLRTVNRDVDVRPYVPSGDSCKLNKKLENINLNYSKKIVTKEHLRKLPSINEWMKAHNNMNPYNFELSK